MLTTRAKYVHEIPEVYNCNLLFFAVFILSLCRHYKARSEYQRRTGTKTGPVQQYAESGTLYNYAFILDHNIFIPKYK